MKTNPSFRIFKPSTLVSLGIAIAAALLTQRASAISTLVITENNSTASGLTALLNGTTFLPVTFNSADNWTITLMGVSGVVGGNGTRNWFEPGAPGTAGFVNTVDVSSLNSPNQLTVLSDRGPGFTGALANNTAETFAFTLNGNLRSLSVTFNDLGDAAAPTPDTGSTLGLLSLSVVALLGATRLRFLQLAA